MSNSTTDTEGENSTHLDKKKLQKLVSSETLDQLMQVVGAKGWLSLFFCFGVLLTALIWGVLGSLPVKVSGNGISMTSSGPTLIISQIEGNVVDIFVSPGETVEKGALVARLENSILHLDILLKTEEVSTKETELQTLISRIAEENQARKATLTKEIESTCLSLKTTENRIAFLVKDYEAKQRLEQKGIVPRHVVVEAETALSQAKIDIESYKANLSRLEQERDRSYRLEEIEAKRNVLRDALAELDRLKLQSKYLDVHSQQGGKILEVIVASGDRVTPGSEIAAMEIPVAKGESLRYYAAFGAQYGDLLDEGLTVDIQVSGIDPKLYGFLLGKTRFISPYPVTTAEIVSEVRNVEVAAYLKGQNQAVYSAVIELDVDPKTKSGYKWTSESGPPWELSSGTIGVVHCVVDRKPPIVYILPLQFSPFFYRLITHQ